MKLKIFVFLFVIFTASTYSQIEVSAGGFIGGGYLQGNSPSVGAFTSSAFLEVDLPLFAEVYPRASIIFTKDFNALLPNTNKPYYPYLLGFTFKGVTTQYFDNKMYLEEGVGLLAINDHTFSYEENWDYGIVLSIAAGFDLRNFNLKGFKLGAGIEFGMTFFNTLPQYSSFHLQFQYTI